MIRDILSLFSRDPSYLIYWVTQGCNFTCDHCFNYLENQKPNDDLSLLEIREVAKHLSNLQYLTLAGGEPFLRQDLAEIVSAFGSETNVRVVNLITNGWFVEKTTEFVREMLQKEVVPALSLVVSLDGFETSHDTLRQKTGSFARCIQLLKQLKAIETNTNGNRFSAFAAGTYNSANATELLPLAEWVRKELGVPYLMGLIRGEVQNPEKTRVDLKHYRKTAEAIQALNVEHLQSADRYKRMRTALSQTVTDVIMASAVENRRLAKCRAGSKGIVLSANGDVLLCEVLGTRLGNVRDHGLDPNRILHLEATRHAVEQIERNRCHCTWECFQTMNAVLSPSLYPKIAARYLGQNRSRVSAQHFPGGVNSQSKSEPVA